MFVETWGLKAWNATELNTEQYLQSSQWETAEVYPVRLFHQIILDIPWKGSIKYFLGTTVRHLENQRRLR